MTKYINAVYNTPYQLKLPVEIEKLKKYAKHISICGESRNSYSKSDNDATFMRVKKDYMGNDQLLPGYNVQLGICDEYIAVFDIKQYASMISCGFNLHKYHLKSFAQQSWLKKLKSY